MKKKLNKKGFTLVELLATIIILGIIVTIVVVSANKIVDDAKEKSDSITQGNIEEAAISYMTESKANNTFVNSLIDQGADDGVINQVSNMNTYYVSVEKLVKNDFIRLKDDKYLNYCVTIEMNDLGKIESNNIDTCSEVAKVWHCGENVNGTTFERCDVNMDTFIDAKDVMLVLKSLSGLTTLTDEQKKLAEAVGDETINSGDVVEILRYLSFRENT